MRSVNGFEHTMMIWSERPNDPKAAEVSLEKWSSRTGKTFYYNLYKNVPAGLCGPVGSFRSEKMALRMVTRIFPTYTPIYNFRTAKYKIP
jgi:hypothetical protein